MKSRDAGTLRLAHSVLRGGGIGRTRGRGLIYHSHLEQHLNSDAAAS